MNNNSLRTSRFTREWVIFFFCFTVMGSWLGYVSYDEYLRAGTLERERLTDNAAVIHDHIEHCLEDSSSKKSREKDLKEFKEITKYL